MVNNPLLVNKTLYRSNALGEEVLNMLDKTFVMPASFSFNVVTVTDDFIARMDLISKQIYGDPDYADILCKINGISNPFELNSGLDIIVPVQADLSKFYYKETYLEKEDEATGKPVPVAKDKKEKRSPNDAVIGDKRYKVDSTRKVIIY